MNDTFDIDGSVRLAHWGVIRARGADASKFLQSQLTNDVATLRPGRARLAGFCSAKGRLQASFIVWRVADDELLLLCAADVLPATLKRLSMFVMRSQCKLSDASAELAPWGVAGATAEARVGAAAVWAVVTPDTATTAVRLPDAAGRMRALCLHPVDAAEPPASTISLDTWRWLEVQSGVPSIEAVNVDQFVPQMLNYELLGGVDFQKGCYPGQEVVARSQYRGTIKRRMFLFDCDAAASAGQEVVHSADPGQPAGRIVNAALRPDLSGSSALVEVKLAALGAGSLHLGSADGPALRRAELPYDVPLEAVQPA